MNQTKKRILKVAEKFFVDFNYFTVSMDDIAKELNISKPALYYHFKNKEEIFVEMSKMIFDDFIDRLKKAIQANNADKEETLEARFQKMVKTYIDFSMQKRDLGRLLMQKFSAKDKKIIKILSIFKKRLLDTVEPLVKEILNSKRREKELDSRLITLFLIGSLNIFTSSKMQGDKDFWTTDDIAKQLSKLIFNAKK